MAVSMDCASFVERYGGVYEHSPWVAENCHRQHGGALHPKELAKLLQRSVDEADTDRKLQLIRAHPDLAGKAAVGGELTAASNTEQASAGIDQCTPAEFEQFQTFNDRYRDKFGFPFVMAVRDSNRQEILAAFSRRLGNDYQAEFDTAIRETHKIARLRLKAMSSET